MKLFTGWVVAAGLVLGSSGAQAQLLAPYESETPSYTAVSDVSGPYAAMPPEAPAARGPTLLPSTEVYTVVRESGFSPLGIPQQRGFFYTIAVVDRGGADGRLVIDARTGQIVRFMPGNRIGDNFNDDQTVNYGSPGALPPTTIRGVPRPPRSIPHVASRTVPMPKASPLAARPAPEPAQQSAAVVKPAETPTAPPAPAPTVGEAKPSAPAPTIQPTQEMPKAQGLE